MKRSEAVTSFMEELIEIMEDEPSTWDSKASRLLKFAEKEIGMLPPEIVLKGKGKRKPYSKTYPLIIRADKKVNEWEPE